MPEYKINLFGIIYMYLQKYTGYHNSYNTDGHNLNLHLNIVIKCLFNKQQYDILHVLMVAFTW